MTLYHLKSEAVVIHKHEVEADTLEDAIDQIESDYDEIVIEWQVDGRMGWNPASEEE